MKGITIPTISMPVISMPSIGVPWIGVPDSGKKGLTWPSGMKEAIKAIYDPKKQGMTNYDVIEAYVEDFTTWDKHADRGTVTVTQNTIHITESITEGNIIEDINAPYADLTVYVTGVTEDTYILVKDMSGRTEEIKRDGLYTFKNNNPYFGFSVNKPTVCDITIKQLPTSILQDLSGNGNHAYLYGGKGKLNSGMGVYQEDFTVWKFGSSVNVNSEKNPHSATLKLNEGVLNFGYAFGCAKSDYHNKSYKVKISTISKDIAIRLISTDGNLNSTTVKSYPNVNNGDILDIPIIPDDIFNNVEQNNIYISIEKNSKDDVIVIEQIPDYPDQLCYDGKMYAVCYGFPILTDYTVMADRTWIEKTNRGTLVSKAKTYGSGAFIFEIHTTDGDKVTSFSIDNLVTFVDDNVTYQTKNSYNGEVIHYGNATDERELYIGCIRPTDGTGYVGCHGKIIIADRSFTEDEITWLKDNWEKI